MRGAALTSRADLPIAVARGPHGAAASRRAARTLVPGTAVGTPRGMPAALQGHAPAPRFATLCHVPADGVHDTPDALRDPRVSRPLFCIGMAMTSRMPGTRAEPRRVRIDVDAVPLPLPDAHAPLGPGPAAGIPRTDADRAETRPADPARAREGSPDDTR